MFKGLKVSILILSTNKLFIILVATPTLLLLASLPIHADEIEASADNHQVQLVDTDNNKRWSLTTIQSNSGIGFWENGPGGEDRFVITQGGRVGIGTQSPDHELVVRGNDPVVDIHDSQGGNSTNAARLRLLENTGASNIGGAYLLWNGSSNQFDFGTILSGVNTATMVIDRANNNVGIGTRNLGAGDFRLMVNGAIRAKEIVVETGWSDYVFDPEYRLASLSEVSDHIAEYGHLPDVPSAEEIARHGVAVGEMQATQMKKIEELTLHIIALEARLASVEGVQSGSTEVQ